jgi:superfamily I DNA/RNA helicase
VNEISKIKKEDGDGSILVLSPVRYYVEDLTALLKEKEIDFVDFWTVKINPDILKMIWWLKAIYLDQKILNMTFIANTTFSDHFKNKYNEIIRDGLQKEFNEEHLIQQVVDMFPEPFDGYLVNAPHILELLHTHQEYAVFENYLNLENLEESLKTVFKKFNPPVEFGKHSVNLMSIHKSKGLQADYVFITGMVDGVLPNKVQGIDTIEAQRRLLFVGLTRSRKNLYVISQVEWEGKYVHRMDKDQFNYDHRKKKYYGRASSFVTEMIKK